MPRYLDLKITLNDITPPIWRSFLVNEDISFYLLHEVIIDVMGWDGEHLYSFNKGKRIICEPDDEGVEDGKKEDALLVFVSDLLKKKGDRIIYAYDFGVGWMHTIELQDIVEKEETFLASCTDGERACPPENCGGIPGYEDVLLKMKNPQSGEYKEFVHWYGNAYLPEYFDLTMVNEDLQSLQIQMQEEGFWSKENPGKGFRIAEPDTEDKIDTDVAPTSDMDSESFKKKGWRILSSSDD